MSKPLSKIGLATLSTALALIVYSSFAKVFAQNPSPSIIEELKTLKGLSILLEAIIKFINAIAWPAVIAFVALRYRNEFRSILERIQTAKVGGAEFSIGQKKEVEEATTKASANLLSELSVNNQFTISSNSDRNVKTGDVDGDGIDELIVFNIEGPYSGRIRVFKPNFSYENKGIKTDFVLIGEIYPVNGLETVQDTDFDKQAEIIVNEDDKESNQPHAAGLRERVTYKWKSNQFIEVSRKKLPIQWTQQEMNALSHDYYVESDKKMHDSFNIIISKLDEGSQKRNLMEQAQKQWLEFREIQAQALKRERGRIGTMVHFQNLTYLTNERIKTLEQIAHPEEGRYSLSDSYFNGKGNRT
jgi:uncharacterized protein YecT (DUF1311 family)